ncbi:MAG TPA: peroxide stress protein YaaA [Kineosporiaceae bacterium]
MLVLLPPSESKATPPRRGRPVDIEALSFPELTEQRLGVLAALAAVSAAPDAAARLGVGASLAADVARNTRLDQLPAVPVSRLYTGVLYDALGWAGLDEAARRRGARRLVVVSALWGALRPHDRVPPYRLAMGTDLPGIGALAPAWRPLLGPALTAAAGPRGVIVDCRSAPYAAAWSPTGALADRTAAVRVFRAGPGGRTVVSHQAKHTRGEVVRHLLATGAGPRDPAGLAECLAGRWDVDLVAPARSGRPWALDVIVPGPPPSATN